MKRVFSVGIVLLSFLVSQAFAQDALQDSEFKAPSPRKYSATEYFDGSTSQDIEGCLETGALLDQISSSDFSIAVTDHCKFHKEQPKGLQILEVIAAGIGTWGISAIVCEHEHDCLNSRAYSSLGARIEISPQATGRVLEGTPVAMNENACLFYQTALSKLDISSSKVNLEARCDGGFLKTALILKK